MAQVKSFLQKEEKSNSLLKSTHFSHTLSFIAPPHTLSFRSLSRAWTTLAPIGPVTPVTAIMGRPVKRASRRAAPMATMTGPGMSRSLRPPSLRSLTWALSSEWPMGLKGAMSPE